jgi:tetratricopeptide (TPR) repeat protein
LPEFKGKLHDIVKDCPDRWQAELGETPDFELALNELGFQLCECGEKSAAQDLLDRACKLAQHMYGQDDIRTAIRLHNYAACLVMNEHKYKEALEILRKVVPSFAKHFREHDGNTIDAHISLGIAQYKSGDISHGMEELLSCEADSIRYLGEGHSSTVNAILAVGDAYGFTGEFEKAAEKSQKAAKLSERIQGTNHPYVDDLKERASRWARVVQLRLQAAAHEDSHRLGEALNSFEEMEAIGEAFAGEAVMAVSRFGKSRIRLLLGHTLEAARDIECAREFAQVGMPNLVQDIRDFISQREVLLSHIQNGDISNAVSDGHVARDLNNEAIELRNKGELARAEQLLRESLEIEIEQRGESHPKVAHRLNNLSSVLVLRNRLDEAKQLLARAWQLKVDQHDITSSRVLFIRLIVALLESESVSVFVGQLKVLLVQEYLRDYAGVAMKWNVTYLLEQFTSNLGERNIEFLTALAAVTNEHSKVSMLDCFPEWRGQSPVPLETPWSA